MMMTSATVYTVYKDTLTTLRMMPARARSIPRNCPEEALISLGATRPRTILIAIPLPIGALPCLPAADLGLRSSLAEEAPEDAHA